jgi:hypothetical protein
MYSPMIQTALSVASAVTGITIFDGTTTVLCATTGNNSLYNQRMNVMSK